tara:strand:- start:319 stop:681 length:363 start_codon:yes stop_codon:yes gene_type:complete
MTDTISIAAKHALFDNRWSPKRITGFDDYDVKIAKIEGEFVWHNHEHEDELFLCTRGRLRIEREGMEPVVLEAGEIYVVPKGLRHKPVAEPYAEIMLIERAGVVNTGTEGGDLTAVVEEI